MTSAGIRYISAKVNIIFARRYVGEINSLVTYNLLSLDHKTKERIENNIGQIYLHIKSFWHSHSSFSKRIEVYVKLIIILLII